MTFELAVVELIHSRPEITSRLKLDKAGAGVSQVSKGGLARFHVPLSIAIAARFGKDDLKTGLPGKILQILDTRGHVSRNPGAGRGGSPSYCADPLPSPVAPSARRACDES